MTKGRSALLILTMLCLNGCHSHAQADSAPARVSILQFDSLNADVTVSKTPYGNRDDLLSVQAVRGDLAVPADGKLVWERDGSRGWQPVTDGPFSSDPNSVPAPASPHSSDDFSDTDGTLAKSIILSTPRQPGRYRACTSTGACISVEIAESGQGR